MKLLLDENLSRRLVPFLQNAYPGTSQVVLLGVKNQSRAAILKILIDHLITIEDALIAKNMACVELTQTP